MRCKHDFMPLDTHDVEDMLRCQDKAVNWLESASAQRTLMKPSLPEPAWPKPARSGDRSSPSEHPKRAGK